MTKAELIAALEPFPDDLPVVLMGFDEDGDATIEETHTAGCAALPPGEHPRSIWILDNTTGRHRYAFREGVPGILGLGSTAMVIFLTAD